jgi:hypothetical protein
MPAEVMEPIVAMNNDKEKSNDKGNVLNLANNLISADGSEKVVIDDICTDSFQKDLKDKDIDV